MKYTRFVLFFALCVFISVGLLFVVVVCSFVFLAIAYCRLPSSPPRFFPSPFQSLRGSKGRRGRSGHKHTRSLTKKKLFLLFPCNSQNTFPFSSFPTRLTSRVPFLLPSPAPGSFVKPSAAHTPCCSLRHATAITTSTAAQINPRT